MRCFYVERTPSTYTRIYGYRRTWDIHTICVPRTAAQPPILYSITIAALLLLYIITYPTRIDKVRIEISIPANVVLDKYVVSTFTGIITVALLLVYYTTRVAIAIPFIHDSRNVALQFVNYIISCHGKRFVSVAIDNRHSVSLM